jgi:hypothetical protein
MPCADERLKPMQGLHGFATQTQMNADKVKGDTALKSITMRHAAGYR